MKPLLPFVALLLLAASLMQGCALKSIRRSKGIVYLEGGTSSTAQKLDVYAPRNRSTKHPVIVYFYGGNWTSGKRSLYSFLGSRWARKGVVMVVADYPKSPEADYAEMATDAAAAVKLVTQNIDRYGGDAAQLFVAGHSAGGHLAALISTDDSYFKTQGIANPVKGTILIDAAGLDMYWYMKEIDYGPQNSYLKVFGKDPESWKKASPMHHLHKGMPPVMMLSGGRSYPTIISSNERFATALEKLGHKPVFICQEKRRHIPMITQFFNTYNPRYRDILQFIESCKAQR